MTAPVPRLVDSPYFTDGHRTLASEVETFCAQHVVPHGHAESDSDARNFMERLASAGLLRWCVSEAGGGHATPSKAALDARAVAVVREALSFGSGLADLCFIMQALGSLPISLAGTAEQQRRFLPRVHTGQAITAFALTEPEAGSDVASLTTRAVRDGDSYVLTGHKKFISQAPLMDLMCIFARTSDQGARGISAFVVERSTPGITVRRQQPMAPHPLGEVLLEGVRIPVENRLGEEGQGMRVALRTLDVCRPTVAAAACGMARRALSEAMTHARTRHQFGKPLWEHQLVGQMLARMVTSLSAAQLLTARACHSVDGGGDATFQVSQAKLNATEAAGRITDDAIQVFGGEGVLQGSVVERLYREVRSLRIYEGTSEIQHLVIARALMKD